MELLNIPRVLEKILEIDPRCFSSQDLQALGRVTQSSINIYSLS